MKTSFNNRRRSLWLAIGVVATLFSVTAFSQTTQTIRGRVMDEESKTPLVGVTVQVLGNFESPLRH